MKRRSTYRLKGFTIAEVLITLVLTSLAITFSYSTLSYIQKLFFNYKGQNRFIQEYSDFKQRMDQEALYAESLIEQSENIFVAKRDSLFTVIDLQEQRVLVKRNDHCDTFHFAIRQIKKNYELIKNPEYANKLIRSFSFETEFSKQKFNFQFIKNNDASVKLRLDKGE